MAMVAKFGGGVAMVLGVLFRPFAFLMTFTMFIGCLAVMPKGNFAPAFAGMIVSALMITGPGLFSLKAMIPKLRGHWWS